MEIDGGQLIGLVAVLSVLTVPALAIGARLALKPIVEALMHLKEMDGGGPRPAVPDRRIFELEAQVSQLQQEVHRLAEAEQFYQQLRAAHEPSRVAPPAPQPGARE